MPGFVLCRKPFVLIFGGLFFSKLWQFGQILTKVQFLTGRLVWVYPHPFIPRGLRLNSARFILHYGNSSAPSQNCQSPAESPSAKRNCH